jgi:hypothetical protein
MRQKVSLILYNKLRNNWKRERCIDVCTYEERRGLRWWKMGVWRQSDEGIY